jgi:hypothetical protein
MCPSLRGTRSLNAAPARSQSKAEVRWRSRPAWPDGSAFVTGGVSTEREWALRSPPPGCARSTALISGVAASVLFRVAKAERGAAVIALAPPKLDAFLGCGRGDQHRADRSTTLSPAPAAIRATSAAIACTAHIRFCTPSPAVARDPSFSPSRSFARPSAGMSTTAEAVTAIPSALWLASVPSTSRRIAS